jgi:anti-sigma regulatory factor (Ser/Thr protein kinase)
MAMQEARLLFRPNPTAAAMGRRILDGLADGLPLSMLDDARLLLTELITNAIQHGHLEHGDRISVTVRREAAGLVVEVSDPGDGIPPSDGRPPGSGNGWGMTLLERLADDWGVEPVADGGTLAWFRLAEPPMTR